MSKRDETSGAAVYSRPVLAIYDWFVLGFSSTFAWQCSASQMLAFYNQHIANCHLDVGVGTGYFLDHCRFPGSRPEITLLDLNPNSLQVTAKRLERYAPQTITASVLQPIALPEQAFETVALNFLLHCLPGDMTHKGQALAQLRPLLRPGGKLFGSTILGQGVRHNWLGRRLMAVYNRRGIFDNWGDDPAGLVAILNQHFSQTQIKIVGCVAFFTAIAN